MCARTSSPQHKPLTVPPAAGTATDDPPAPDGATDEHEGTGMQMQFEEGTMGTRKDDRFPATKAPGRLY